MGKTRFVYIRDLPAKCQDYELRTAFERHGIVQDVRILKDGPLRYGVVSYTDVKSAAQAVNANIKLNDVPIQVEYCDSSDISGIIFKLRRSSTRAGRTNQGQKRKRTNQNARDHVLSSNMNGKPVHSNTTPSLPVSTHDANYHLSDQAVYPVQSSVLLSHNWRGIKLSHLPLSRDLSDEHLRRGLFAEFKRCGRIVSVVLPGALPSDRSSDAVSETSRVAIVTFRRPEEAQCAYQAIRTGGKLLFSPSVTAEPHPGFSENCPSRVLTSCSLPNASPKVSLCSANFLCTSSLQNLYHEPASECQTNYDVVKSVAASKLPTRTLFVGGLIQGSTGPVSSEQLTTAFRKFGDIIDVQLQTNSSSALIQFAEMRGPIRAMNAHTRDPLRLGGRPLFLAYVPSPPSTGLWFSDLPPFLANLPDKELLHRLSQLVPIEEITLITRTDPNSRSQHTSQVSLTLNNLRPQLHYAAYIRLASPELASLLLNELRSDKACSSSLSNSANMHCPKRLMAVDFASPRQATLVNTLHLNAARSGGSGRTRIISAASLDLPKGSVVDPSALHTSAAPTGVSASPNIRQHAIGRLSERCSVPMVNPRTIAPLTAIPRSVSVSVSHAHTMQSTRSAHSNRIISQESRRNPARCSHHSSNPASTFSGHPIRSRDTSPSSLSSISDDSSVLSSESSSSTVSSTSSSVSSSTSSGSSTHSKAQHELSSNYTKSRLCRSITPRTAKSASGVKVQCDATSTAITLSTNGASHKVDLKRSLHTQDFHWTNDTAHVSSARRPLSVVTTVASTMASPVRGSTGSSGALSSPGGSSSSIATTGVSLNLSKTSHDTDSRIEITPVLGQSPFQPAVSGCHPPATTTVLLMGEFQMSPTTRNVPLSASSGVSSGSRSFSSNSSSGSSPLNSTHVALRQTSLGSKQTTTVTSSQHCHSKTSSSVPNPIGCASAVSNTISRVGASRPASKTCFSERKSRLYCTEVSSGLKLHLSSNCPSENSTITNSPSTTTPLTLSLKLVGVTAPSRTSRLASPLSFSAHSQHFVTNTNKRDDEPQPLTPVSAPPLNYTPSVPDRTSSAENGYEKQPNDYSNGGLSSHSSEWIRMGSPVYESMYDKIKRRTNKETEERKRRQLEALAMKQMRRRKQLKKEERGLATSPMDDASCIPPESFEGDYGGKAATANTICRSHKFKWSTSRLQQPLTSKKYTRKAPSRGRNKENDIKMSVRPSAWHSSKPLGHIWHQSTTSVNGVVVHRESERSEHRLKRCRRDVSSLSSSVSSECDRHSASPPGTLTRLSLGMRFPVSATYHECIRMPKGSFQSSWSSDEDNESFGHLSSSLSHCGSQKSSCTSRRPLTKFQARSELTHSLTSSDHKAHQAGSYFDSYKHSHFPTSTVSSINAACNTHKKSHLVSAFKLSTSSLSADRLSGKTDAPCVGSDKIRLMSKSGTTPRSRLYSEENGHFPGLKRRRVESLGSLRSSKKSRSFVDSDRPISPRNYHQNHGASTGRIYRSRVRSPQSCFSDDGTVLDSDIEDAKSSSLLPRPTYAERFQAVRWPRMHRRRLSTCVHSGSDDSSLVTRSPSPPHCRMPTQLSREDTKLNRSTRRCSLSRYDDADDDSVFDTFGDSDRFSTNSKSTPSTEPMEQSEFIERSSYVKFSGDEWHSSVPSDSPHPTNLDFDVEYCLNDKTEQSSTTYQSTSFSSQMLSPTGKLPSPNPSDSDDGPMLMARDVNLISTVSTCELKSDSITCETIQPPLSGTSTSDLCDTSLTQDPTLWVKSEPSFSPRSAVASPSIPPTHREQPLDTLSLSKSVPNSQLGTHCYASDTDVNGDIVTRDSQRESLSVTVCPSVPPHRSSTLIHDPLMQSPLQPLSTVRSPTTQNSMIDTDSELPAVSSTTLSPTTTSGPTISSPSTVLISARVSASSSSLLSSTVIEESAEVGVLPTLELKSVSPPQILTEADTCSESAPVNVNLATPSSCTVTTVQPKLTTSHSVRKLHSSSSETKSTSVIMSPSTGSLTELHDITKYVQSVIERVKAERVEETQQAASAAACLHSTAPTCSVSQASRFLAESPNTAISSFIVSGASNRRSSGNTKKALLVTTSSSIKPSSGSAMKWSNSHGVFLPETSATSTELSIPTNSTSMLSVTGQTPYALPVHSTNDIQMLSIPGVNACAPLVLADPPTHGRLTRLSQQQFASAQANIQRAEAASSADAAVPHPNTTPAPGPASRRRKRSESKVTTVLNLKDSTPSSFAMSEPTHAHLKTAVPTISSPPISSPYSPQVSTDAPISGDVRHSSMAITASISTSPSVALCTSNTAKSTTSVDPYEPNFDDESPPGFDHSPLHHHRSTPPICFSPVLHQPQMTSLWKPSVNSSSVSTIHTPTSVSSCPSPNSNMTLSSPAHIPPSGAISLHSNAAARPNVVPADSVDEVIRDVCAGQFDVQSYMNNWRGDLTKSSVLESNSIPSSKSTPSSSAVTSTLPLASTTSNSSAVTMPASATSLPSAKPFPLSLTSEPVVAAVTIPVGPKVGGNKAAVSGTNGSNSNMVSVGTGNALLNTLLAALQLIPGSQVTVTGPAAAAGVVGGLGNGTISATTITLPVNAARQAAANIKAAVLSAANAATSTNPESEALPTPPDQPPLSECQRTKLPAPQDALITPLGSTILNSSTCLDSLPKIGTSVQSEPLTNISNSATTSSPSAVHAQPSNLNVRTRRATGTQPRRTALSSKISDSARTVTTKSVIPPVDSFTPAPLQAKNVAPNCITTTLHTAPFHSASLSAPVQHLRSESLPLAPSSTCFVGPTHYTTTFVNPSNTQHLSNPGNIFSSSPHLPSSQLAGASIMSRPTVRPSVRAPQISTCGRSPSLLAHNFQTLIDRLGGAVEPSVLMAFAQVAASTSGLCGDTSESVCRMDTEVQVVNYLRRLAHRLSGPGTCSRVPVAHGGPNSFIDTQGKNISRVVPTSSSASQLLPQSNLQHYPSATVSPSVYTSGLSPNPTLLTANSSAAVSRSNVGLGISSPPVVPPRSLANQIGPTASGLASDSHISWNALTQAYPLVWQGRLSLKNTEARVDLHYIYGNPDLLRDCMRLLASGGGGQPQHSLVVTGGPLRIVQRMRLEPAQLEGVQRKIHQDGASCVCLALPAGSCHVELMQQTQILNENFIRYMQEKMAAGIINVGIPDYQHGLYVVHIFPPCEFSHAQLSLAAPELHCRVVQANQSHLLVVITTV